MTIREAGLMLQIRTMVKKSISFIVTTHNETDSLKALLTQLKEVVRKNDEIIVVDDNSENPETLSILKEAAVTVYKHTLNKDYAAHKNIGIEKAIGGYIVALDADELLSDDLKNNIHEIIWLSKVKCPDCIYVPRKNIVEGMTEADVKRWGWSVQDGNVIQWPDLQSRIFRRDYPRIKWERPVHETISGFDTYAVLPYTDYSLCIIHTKTIERQTEANEGYINDFGLEANGGQPR